MKWVFLVILLAISGGIVFAQESQGDSFRISDTTASVMGYVIEYDITGAKLSYMISDENSFSLLLNVDTTKQGQLTLNLPRELIDAKKQNGQDETFIILIDGMEVVYHELLNNSKYRKITINFEHGDSEIEIIGTTLLKSIDCNDCISDDTIEFLHSSEGWISYDDMPTVYEEPDPDVVISRLHDQINDLKLENKSLKQEIKNLKETIKN